MVTTTQACEALQQYALVSPTKPGAATQAVVDDCLLYLTDERVASSQGYASQFLRWFSGLPPIQRLDGWLQPGAGAFLLMLVAIWVTYKVATSLIGSRRRRP